MTKMKLNNRRTAEPVVAGKSLEQWEGEWKPVKGGFGVPHPELRDVVGLFRAVSRDGEVRFIGVGTEHANGGLRKRVADFTRPSASAREHHGGEYIHDHQNELRLEVLVTGSDKHAGLVAEALKDLLLELHAPKENARGPRRRKVVVPIQRPSSVVAVREAEASPNEHRRQAA
jgi:hypothetical protein